MPSGDSASTSAFFCNSIDTTRGLPASAAKASATQPALDFALTSARFSSRVRTFSSTPSPRFLELGPLRHASISAVMPPDVVASTPSPRSLTWATTRASCSASPLHAANSSSGSMSISFEADM
eukprot:scaffold50_cov107-Isochrysis_galbana.AAC.5